MELIQILLIFSTFIITKRRRTDLLSQMHSKTVIHSWCPGSVLYRVYNVVSITTWLHWLVPIPKLVSSILSQVLAAVLGKHSAAPLIRLYKAKERNGALRGSRAYIHNGMMPNNIARSLCSAGGSLLKLDPSHVPVRSRVSTYP